MKKLYFLCFCIGLSSFSQLNAQCPYNNTYYTTVTPPCPGSTTVSCMYGGEYVTVNVVAGNVYTFSTCGSTNFDSQLTLYNNIGTTVLAYNDDACGFQSSITWTATYTGTVQILLDQYYCLNISSCMNLTISCAPPGGSGSGCNTNTILCQNSAGPFSFGSPGPAVSNCLDWYSTSQFAYILVNITTSGPLNLLIDGNATSGYLDVAVFNIPTNQDPCTAIQNTANQLGCNYASSSSGCNQFGTYYGCASSVPSPYVTAGQTIMIVVEDWLDGPSSTFNLQLGPPPNAQSGPPDPTITPVGPFCITSSSVQLTAVDMGGIWSGPGVSPSGLFNPSIAGVGTHTINYTIGQPPCQANSSITITVTTTPTPTITPTTASICTGQSINLTAGGGGTYQWNTGATTAGITVSPGATTTYTVTVTLSGGCTATTSRTVTVNSPPTASISPATTSICTGQSTTLTASGGGTYQWNTGATTASITVSPGATTTYTVTVTNAAGCTATATRTVVVNPLPTPSITGINTICAGQSTTLTASGGGTYAWNTGATTAGITVSPGTSTTYTVTVSSAAGCTASSSQLVTVNPLPTPTAGNNGPLCIGNTLNLTSSGGGSYSWTGPYWFTSTMQDPSLPNVTTANSGIYIVTVTNASGCTGTASTTVTVQPLPTPSITGINTICAGESTTLTASGGGTYQWNTGATTAGITVSPGATTTYTVTVTLSGGCTATTSRTVTVNPPPTPSITGTTSICSGQSTTLTASGGGTYAWNTGATTAGITVSPGATTSYTVTVTSVAGCTGTASTTVTVNPLPTPSIAGTNTICLGQSTTLTASGGGTYSWNTGATTASITVSPGATTTYTVTVTNAAGCTATATRTVVVNPLPTPSITGINTICAGQSTTLTASGGGTYAWNTGATTAGITVSPGTSTTYTVTVSSAAGCTASSSQLVTVNPLPTPTAGNNGPLCTSNTLNLTSSGGSSYSWTGPGGFSSTQQNPSIPNTTVANGGTYTVTVTSASGCTATASTTVTINPNLVVSASSNAPVCVGATLTLSTAGGTSYSWVGPGGFTSTQQNPSIPNATAGNSGTYTVTVTNASGCTGTASTTVTVNPLPTPGITGSNTICAGQSTTLTASGGGTYQWNTGATTADITVSPGTSTTYTVTVSSAAGCTASSSQLVTVNPLPTPTISGASAICAGQSTILTANGGSNYSWNTGSVSNNITVNPLTTTTYTVTVTDVNGCTASTSYVLTINPSLNVSVTTDNNVSCFGFSDGSLTATPSGGTPGFTYVWSNGSNNATATGLPFGIYTVTVTDAAGCTGTATGNITQPTPVNTSLVPSVYAGGYNVSGCVSDGSIDQSVTGGTSTYTYQWSNGQTTEDISGLAAGTYTVTVTDANGCTVSSSITLTAPSSVTAATSSATYVGGWNISCNGMSNGSIDLTVGGGAPGYSYSWSSGQTTEDISGLAAGTYTVTVTDANGCTTSTSISLTQPPVLSNGVTSATYVGGWNISCNGMSDASIDQSVTGGTSTYTYQWSNGQTSEDISGVAAGSYTVTVTDANGCTASTSITLTEPPALSNNVTTATYVGGWNISCNGLSDGSIDQSATGGTTVYTYQWSNGQTSEDISGVAAGTYTVTVTDANGCTASTSITLTQPTPVNTSLMPSVYAGGYNVSGCVNDGSIDQSVTGGTSTYTYQWSSGQTTEDISGLAAGTYTVTVTDANGCTVSSSITLTAPSSVTAATSSATYVGGWNISCNGMSNGSIDLTVGGGAPGYSYSWSSGQTTEDISGVAAGTYTVTVTDANGCTASTSITLTQPPVLSNNVTAAMYVGGWNISCNGLSDGSIDQSVTGGTSTYTYQWSSGQTTEDINGVAAGTYTVTVTDANGCTASTSITLTQPPALSNSVTAATYVGGWNISCNGMSNGSIDQTATGGTTVYIYQWSSGQTSEDISGLAAGTYTVTVTDANGCTASTSITLTEPPTLSISTGTNDDGICKGEQSDVFASSNGGTGTIVFSWNQGLPDGTPHIVSPTVTTTYIATATDENGCTVSSSLTIEVYPNPVSSFTSTEVCEGNATSFTSTSTIASGSIVDYQWDFSGSNASGATATYLFLSAGSHTVSLTVTSDHGCMDTVTQNIIVNANPDPGFTADNLSGCVPLCVTFSDLSTVQGSSINSWDWLVDGQNLNIAQPTYCFNQIGVYNVSLTVTSAEGCSSTLAINNMIQVNPNPVAAFTIQYESIVLSEASFTPMNQSSGETSWLWDFGNNNTSTDELPLIHYTDTGIYCITLTVMNQYGCTDQAENCVYIYPDFYIYIPNSFTPNGDKTNDVFMIEGFGIKEVDLEIFDRWGNVVFHSPHLYVGWDGTHQASSEEVMQGVYVYKAIVIDFNNQSHEFMGHINLIR